MKGSLIVFDGIDGSGKTTQARLLKLFLKMKGYPAIYTKEPTRGRWGRIIMEMIDKGAELMGKGKELLELFINDRREHVEGVIRPSLEEGKIVIVDRYYFSSIAYQGAFGIDPAEIKSINESFAPLPNLAFLLNISIEKALLRIKISRGDIPNIFERKEYLTKVKDIFDRMNEPYIVKLDAEKEIYEVFRDVLDAVNTRLFKL